MKILEPRDPVRAVGDPTGLVNPAEYGRKWILPEQELTGDRGRKSAKPPETRPWEDIAKFPRTMFRDALLAILR